MTNVFMNADIPCLWCHNLHNSEQLHLITMQDCLQGNVVIHTAGVSLLCKQHLQHFDRLSEQSILLFYKDMRYNEPKKKPDCCKTDIWVFRIINGQLSCDAG